MGSKVTRFKKLLLEDLVEALDDAGGRADNIDLLETAILSSYAKLSTRQLSEPGLLPHADFSQCDDPHGTLSDDGW
jgi:hypothetical protein